MTPTSQTWGRTAESNPSGTPAIQLCGVREPHSPTGRGEDKDQDQDQDQARRARHPGGNAGDVAPPPFYHGEKPGEGKCALHDRFNNHPVLCSAVDFTHSLKDT